MKKHVGLLLAIGIFFLQLVLIPYAGMTWDEPSSFFFGRANLKFWQTGNRAYVVDFKNPELFTDSPFPYIYGEDLYPPFAFLVQSAFSYVFAENLGWVTVIDAHHIGEVFIGALGVWAFYELLILLGLPYLVSAATTVIYSLYPTIFGQMRSDAKDVPLMSMLVVTVYFFIRWIQALQAGKRGFVVLPLGFMWGICFGVSLATKPTAAILLPILAAWIGISYIVSPMRKTLPKLWHMGSMVFDFSMLGVLSFLAVWPWLWDDPIGKLRAVWSFFKTVGYMLPVLYFGKVYYAGVDVPIEYPFGMLFVQTPFLVSILATFGVIVSIIVAWRTKSTVPLFAFVWFGIGMGRFFLPGVLIYAKVRHFIDVMPAFFILVGYGLLGVGKILEFVGCWWKSSFASEKGFAFSVSIVAGIVIVHQLLISIRLFPYEPSYFNASVGGIQNVAAKELFDSEYWASGVKEAMDYVNKTYPNTAVVYPCQLWHIAHFYADAGTKVVRETGGSNIVILPNSPSWFKTPVQFHRSIDELVYTVKRDGAELFYVFSHEKPFGWNCGPETEANWQ